RLAAPCSCELAMETGAATFSRGAFYPTSLPRAAQPRRGRDEEKVRGRLAGAYPWFMHAVPAYGRDSQASPSLSPSSRWTSYPRTLRQYSKQVCASLWERKLLQL